MSDEAVGDVMDGLSKGSASKLTDVFKLEIAKWHLTQSFELSPLPKATDLYSSLQLA